MRQPDDSAHGEKLARRARHIVVIDDNETVSRAFTFALKAQGYRVLVLPSAAMALRAELPKRACLVMNCQLCDMNAFELLAKLRHQDPLLPALLTTNSLSLDICRQALAAGCPVLEMPLISTALPLWIEALSENGRSKQTAHATTPI